MQSSHFFSAPPLEIPSFSQSIQSLLLNARQAWTRRATGLSVLDIDDASHRATLKNGLIVRPSPNQAMRTV